jgi:polyisoprenoid-binding protein YceI
MRYHTPLTGLFSILALASAAPAADLYKVDPVHTSVVFSVAHTGLSYTYGMFRKVSGAYQLDKANAANNQFQFVIQTDSVDTNNQERDDHLRSADFFNAAQYPDITFQSTKCTASVGTDNSVTFQVTGDLTIHGQKKSVTIPLRMLGEGLGARKDPRTGFLCQIEIKRSDFGMNQWLKDNLVGDAIGITVSFEGVLQQSPGTAPRQ